MSRVNIIARFQLIIDILGLQLKISSHVHECWHLHIHTLFFRKIYKGSDAFNIQGGNKCLSYHLKLKLYTLIYCLTSGPHNAKPIIPPWHAIHHESIFCGLVNLWWTVLRGCAGRLSPRCVVNSIDNSLVAKWAENVFGCRWAHSRTGMRRCNLILITPPGRWNYCGKHERREYLYIKD